LNDVIYAGWPIEKKIGVAFGLALLTLLVIGIISYREIDGLIGTARWVAQTHHVLEHLSDLRSYTNQIETGALGYVITLKEPYLDPYRRGTALVYETIRELSILIVDAGQRRRLEELRPVVDERIALAQRLVELRRNGGFDSAVQLIQTGRGKQLTDEIQRRLVEMEDEERALLEQRERAAQMSARRTYYSLLAGSFFNVLTLAAAGIVLFRDIEGKKRVEQALQRSNDILSRSVSELEQRTQEISRMSEMGDLLHSCQTVDEAYQVIVQCVPQILNSISGALGIISTSRNLVEIVITWGEPLLGERVFSPEDCWALRRGRLNLVQDPDSALHCRHLGDEKPDAYLCLPLVAHGEALGLVHLQRCGGSAAADARAWMSEARQRLVGTVADQIALAVANLRLREALRQQSVRDPLTGLFNRRYMEESLDLELRRAARNGRSLGILMLDLDNFKLFNDSFGHDAGDTMLREFSSLLRGGIRSCDIACRYGGEEFALILPEASLEGSRQRAEQLRERARHLNAQHRLENLGNITVSIGVAAFPEHGNSAEVLLNAADKALYRAKLEGRNRVIVAPILQPERHGDSGELSP
jgi:diguanylate cyclase (GGDEF)-like protein